MVAKPITEQRNTRSRELDRLSVMEIITLMNEEDHTVPLAVQAALPQIERVIEVITGRLQHGGRLFYVGAGTSGRMGVLDASECPPTFGTDRELVTGLIAGGPKAFFEAIENAEDDEEAGRRTIRQHVTAADIVVGLAASGRTPYVLGAIREASVIGAATAGLSCNRDTLLSAAAGYAIEVHVGPEIVTGSTRLKAASAQKMVLNMISTATMIRLGKVYKNLMVQMRATNQKLRERVVGIIMEAAGVDEATARLFSDKAGGDASAALLMLEFGLDGARARKILAEAGGHFGVARQQLAQR